MSNITVRHAYNSGAPSRISDAAVRSNLGNQLSKVKVTFTGLASSATQNITTTAAKAAALAEGIVLDTGEGLPPIGQVVSLRVVTGGSTGPRSITDEDGTATTDVALLSDDGSTLTFEAAVTALVLTYYPAPAVSLGSVASPNAF